MKALLIPVGLVPACDATWSIRELTAEQLGKLGDPPAKGACAMAMGHSCPHSTEPDTAGRRFRWLELNTGTRRVVCAGWKQPTQGVLP